MNLKTNAEGKNPHTKIPLSEILEKAKLRYGGKCQKSEYLS